MTRARLFMARVGTLILTILMTVWALVIGASNWIGRSTVVDDYNQLIERLPAFWGWLFATPWWVPAGLAAALSAFLVWLAWPWQRSGPSENLANPPNWQPPIVINMYIPAPEAPASQSTQHSDAGFVLGTVKVCAYVHWNPQGTINRSYNISGVTDNGVGDFTFTFDKPLDALDAHTLVVLPIGETPQFKVLEATRKSVRVMFDREPAIISIRFDSLDPKPSRQT